MADTRRILIKELREHLKTYPENIVLYVIRSDYPEGRTGDGDTTSMSMCAACFGWTYDDDMSMCMKCHDIYCHTCFYNDDEEHPEDYDNSVWIGQCLYCKANVPNPKAEMNS